MSVDIFCSVSIKSIRLSTVSLVDNKKSFFLLRHISPVVTLKYKVSEYFTFNLQCFIKSSRMQDKKDKKYIFSEAFKV